MTETRFYEPGRLSSPFKPLFSLTPCGGSCKFLQGGLCRRKIVFSSFSVVKDFWNVTIFGTGASSIPEATPFATPTHLLPPGNPYCVSTVVEFLVTSTNFTITTPTQRVSFPPLLAELFRNLGITVYLDMLEFVTSSKIPVDTDKAIDIITY